MSEFLTNLLNLFIYPFKRLDNPLIMVAFGFFTSCFLMYLIYRLMHKQ